MTHRQMLAWNVWLELQWNLPDRTDHYLMFVIHEIRYCMAEKKRSFNSKDYKLPFKREEGSKPKLTKEQATQYALARLSMMAGPPAEIRYKEKEPDPEAE